MKTQNFKLPESEIMAALREYALSGAYSPIGFPESVRDIKKPKKRPK